MGYYYPPPPVSIGGAQPYAPRLGIAQSGPVPDAPPQRGAIALATFGVILASWQPPFFEPQGAGDIAPIIQTPVVASQPPVPGQVVLNTILRSWDPPLFLAQGAGDSAPLLPAAAAASQPPTINRASQAIALSSWQIDSTTVIWTNAIGSQSIAAPQPPVSSVTLQTIVQSWAQPFFLVQGAGDIAPSLPIVSQPQPVSAALLYSIRTTWDPPWLSAYMQGAGDIAPTLPANGQPSQPPVLTSVNLQTILQAWQPPFAIPQGANDIAPTLPAPVGASQPPTPTSVNFETVLQSWLPGFVLPQRSQNIATQPVVNAPPVSANSLIFELVAANQPPAYSIPKAATVASWLPPAGAPSQPQPVSAATLNLILRAWDPPVWWPLPDNGPIAQVATVVNLPPLSSPAQMYALVAASQPPFILPPTGADFAPLFAPPTVAGSPPPSTANLRVLLQSWDAPAAFAQPRAVVTASGPVPQPPPPSSRVNLQTIVQLNQPPWTYGQGFGFIAAYPVYVPLILTGSPRYVVHHLRARRFTVSAITYLQFEPLDPAESVELIFDFAPDLPPGVIVSGPPVVTIILVSGTDANPAGIRNGTPGIDATSTQVIVPVKGGADGNKYGIKVVQTTTDPELVLALTGILQMVEGA